jgi:GAF domain-containing protein
MELSAILNSTLQFSEVLRRTVEAATRLMECEVGSLLLLNEDCDELVFEVALGERGGEVREVRLKVGEGIAGWVAKTGKPAVVNNVKREARCPLSPPGRRPYAFHNAEHDLRTRQEPESDHRGPSGN